MPQLKPKLIKPTEFNTPKSKRKPLRGIKRLGAMARDTARELGSIPGNISRLHKAGKLGQAFNPGSPASKRAQEQKNRYYKGKYR